MEERTGEAFEFDEKLTVVGGKLEPGNKAPDFKLEHFDGSTMKMVGLHESKGKVRLLNVVNSLDTPVCHVETRHWDKLRTQMPPDVAVYTISMDLPFAQARWQSAEGVEHPALSAHKDEQFAIDYGVLLKEWRLLQRAVFVIDRDDTIVHVEYVPDQMKEPDYDTAVNTAVNAASK